MTRYYCKKCRYKFKSDQPKEMCPYCGEKEIAEEQTAEEIMRDVEKILE